MASKLNIKTDSTEEVDSRGSGRSTPSSVQAPGQTKAGFEAFLGQGNSVAGKRVKGKGLSGKKVEEMPEGSKLWRNTGLAWAAIRRLCNDASVSDRQWAYNRKPRIITPDTHLDGRRVPAALNIPFGHLFFGYPHVPLKKKEEGDEGGGEGKEEQQPARFVGDGARLSGRSVSQPPTSTNGNSPAKDADDKTKKEEESTFSGKGNSLSGRRDADVIVLDD
jgi:ubiquitin fusion degradation protein 1